MQLTTVGTGSSGNAYLLWYDGKALLLDAGVKAKTIIKAAGWDTTKILACLVTHEHGDHACAVKDLTAVGIDCYGTPGTCKMVEGLKSHNNKRLEIGCFIIEPFDVVHDSQEPCGYLILNTETHERLLYATDTRYLPYRFPMVDYWLIECNHCDDLLENEPNVFLANRIRETHLSLETLCTALSTNDMSHTKQIILCHLSRDRGDSKRMINEVNKITRVYTCVAQNSVKIDLSGIPF